MPKHDKIPWDERYKLGVDVIDEQHEKLFSLVNRLYRLEDKKNISQDIKDILHEFNDYINTHFKAEEEYMESIEYPQLQEHKEMHKKLTDFILSIINMPAKPEIIKSKMRIVAKRVLIEHIIHEDSKIKLFEKSKEKPERLVFDITDVDVDDFDKQLSDVLKIEEDDD